MTSATEVSAAGDEDYLRALPWILRIGLAACFIGHGALGLDGMAAWTSYFGVVGIGHDTALALMPWVGALDVALAVTVLVVPLRTVVFYMVAWTVWTALLRPLAGESFWEAIERAGNYGIPLALWFLLDRRAADPAAADRPPGPLAWVLRLTTVLLLLGHGALGMLVRKPVFAMQYAAIGLPGALVEPWVGAFECLLAVAVLCKPDRWLLVAVLVWKLATEALAPIAGSPVWVFVEHGGSYAAPVALLVLLARRPPSPSSLSLPAT